MAPVCRGCGENHREGRRRLLLINLVHRHAEAGSDVLHCLAAF